MASTNSVQQQQQQQHQTFQQQASNSTYHCKDCGIYLNSAKSLEVHLQYHKENLLNKWATQAATASAHPEETNNNTANTIAGAAKREFVAVGSGGSSASAADSSDSMQKKSPEYVGPSRSTPETGGGLVFGHQATPQSYPSSGSSPYQAADAGTTAFSPNFPSFSQVKVEPSSPPVPHYQYGFQEAQFFAMEQQQQQQQHHHQQQQQHQQQQYAPAEYVQGAAHKYRFHPYSGYERPQVSRSSPVFQQEPTSSPSPNHHDKCGTGCDVHVHANDHRNLGHQPALQPLPPFQGGYMFNDHQQQQHLLHHQQQQQQPPAVQLKTEDAQSDILDLDSHKVHQVYPEDEKRQNGDALGAGGSGGHPHSVNAMLGSWQQHGQQQQQQLHAHKIYHQDHVKMFQLHGGPEYMGNGVGAPVQEGMGNGMPQVMSQQQHSPQQQQQQQQQPYRPFEHLPPQTSPTITSSQPGTAPPAPGPPTPGNTNQKSANWKSNEARRPKTYNCTACNKWFTSSGHLKRHYNTTLHKNAVKASGLPDPATLPISAHHHPAREAVARDDSSGSPGEEIRSDDPVTVVAAPPFERGLLPQPPNGPYDRQPAPNIHLAPPLHSPMGGGLPNGGSPNNGDLGADQRGGLLGFGMMPPVVEGTQFQVYPNELAPHVTQAMDISSLSTTGEFHQEQLTSIEPLPSFAQFHIPRLGLLVGSCDDANVGGGGTATAPSSYMATSNNSTTSPFYPEQHYVLADVPDLLSSADVQCAHLTTTYVHVSDEGHLLNEEQGHLLNEEQGHLLHEEQGHLLNEEQGHLLNEEQGHLLNEEHHHQLSLAFPVSPSLGLRAHNNNNDSDETLDVSLENLDESLMSECDARDLQQSHMQQQQKQPRAAPARRGRPKRDYEELSATSRVTSTQIGGQHKCFECDKKFNKPCYLTQHNKTFHSGDKPFKCQTCGKRFSTEPEYGEHQKKHNGDKPHKCELCPKQFNHKTDLRRHMCLHTGHKPYTCETCGKGFIRKDHMLKHCETHQKKNKRV